MIAKKQLKKNIPMYKVILENNSINPIIEKNTTEQQAKIDNQTKKKRLFNKKTNIFINKNVSIF